MTNCLKEDDWRDAPLARSTPEAYLVCEPLERDDFSSSRHPALASWLSKIFSESQCPPWGQARGQASWEKIMLQRNGDMTAPISSLIDRAGLNRVRIGQLLARGLEGADDGELFLEYRQSEVLVFDNGRLKQATYDTAQGFGLRAVKDDAG